MQTYDGRRSPGNEKLYYLLHFGDCCHRAASGLAHAASLLKQSPLQTWSVASSPGEAEDKSLKAWFEIALEDIDFLRGQLEDIETQIRATRIMVRRTS